ncbi:UDP-glucose 4-epimerase GalE [Microbacterium sp. NPDC058389]|uniref:UDP-glucose 4-epimerase GalE n=1 Tax=Microbacterium sp. NPDC058389 TaxID=3346475 RepID=UPI00365C5888
MRVLVTGGAGYVGSHTVLALAEAGHDVVIADDFSNSKRSVVDRLSHLSGIDIECHEVDLVQSGSADGILVGGSIDAVIHCAGLKAVGESVANPTHYYRTNLASTLSVLESMEKYGVRRLVFSSSATVYGSDANPPFEEDRYPLDSASPYGQSKVMIERILADVAKAREGWKVALLRYFNPVGAHESGMLGEDPQGTPNNLMPYIAQVAVGRRPHLTIHGDDYETVDGTGERDYIHVADLAAGHVAALQHLDTMLLPVRAFNLGTGKPTSVLQLVRAFEEESGQRIPFSIGPRREGDLAVAFANPARAHAELGWTASRTVNQMCADTWRWQSANPMGLRESIGSAVHERDVR